MVINRVDRRVNARGVRLRAEIKLLCFDQDKTPVLVKYKATPFGSRSFYLRDVGTTHTYRMYGISAQRVWEANNGKYLPANAYIRMFLNDVPIYESLWQNKGKAAKYMPDGENYWFDDAAVFPGDPDEPDDEDDADDDADDGDGDDEDEDEGLNVEAVDWESLPDVALEAKSTYDTQTAAARTDAEDDKQAALEVYQSDVAVAAAPLQTVLQTAYDAAMGDEDLEEALRLKKAVNALSDDPETPLTKAFAKSDLTFAEAAANEAVASYTDKVDMAEEAHQDLVAEAAVTFRLAVQPAEQELVEALHEACRAAIEADDLVAADLLTGALDALGASDDEDEE